MCISRSLRPIAVGAAIVIACAGFSAAQTARTETVAASAASQGTVYKGAVKGDETVDYLVTGAAGQMLSVDLSTSNASLYFNVLPQGSQEALFIGSTSGNVADIPLPADGTYAVRLYLMRNAARRSETASYALGIGLAGADFADGLAGGPDWWAVSGINAGALNLRTGPGTRYDVVGKVQNGEVAQNRGCRMTGPDRWCNIRVQGSGAQGWVAGKYLIETAPPRQAEVAAGGPVGNGMPFDATGTVDCSTLAGEAMRTCPFGVVRDGPGNAGVWIALGGGKERHILFEGGKPVSTDGDAGFSYRKNGDLFDFSIGTERYAFPDALVNGG